VGPRPGVVVRAARVPRRQRARARDRARALRALSRGARGGAGEDPRQSCAAVARDLRLGERLLEAASGNAGVAPDELARIVKSRNVVAALLEAAIAALFLEHGYEPIEAAVVAAFSDRIDYAATTHVDHKTELQEALARSGRQVSYVVLDVEGPPHDRRFRCAALVDGEELGRGEGRSKKDAEQIAARQALTALAE
jgi:ribonuclease-3